jgi:hypothetical protein
MTREEYREWTPVPLADPRQATVKQFVHGMKSIVEAEGPVIASRVFAIYSRAAGLGRIYEDTRKRFVLSLDHALKEGILLAEREDSADPATWVIRAPGQKPAGPAPSGAARCTRSRRMNSPR